MIIFCRIAKMRSSSEELRSTIRTGVQEPKTAAKTFPRKTKSDACDARVRIYDGLATEEEPRPRGNDELKVTKCVPYIRTKSATKELDSAAERG